jgi:hypothetical protein
MYNAPNLRTPVIPDEYDILIRQLELMCLTYNKVRINCHVMRPTVLVLNME